MYSLDKEKIINRALKFVMNEVVKFFRKKLKKNDYNEDREKLENKLNKMSNEKILRWKNERQSGKK